MNGKKLLADLLDMKLQELNAVIDITDRYQKIEVAKGNGSMRIVYAPHQKLKELQSRILKILYRVPLRCQSPFCRCDRHVVGFRKGLSYVHNADRHLRPNTNFVLRMDLKDAFPSVKREYLRLFLEQVFMEEIALYARGEYREKPLFPARKVGWFRKLIRESAFNLFQDPFFFPGPLRKILDEFIEILLYLLTYRGRLPQGAPTSPWLFVLVLSRTGLIEKMWRFLWENEVRVSQEVILTAYSDDFTISAEKPISKAVVKRLVALIEKESFFSVNRDKTIYYQRHRIAPLVTGLRLIRLHKTREEVEAELQSKGFQETLVKTLMSGVPERGIIIESLGFPKEKIRNIRGIIHQARSRPELAGRVDGFIAALKNVYGDTLPNQIAIPYQKYLKSLEG